VCGNDHGSAILVPSGGDILVSRFCATEGIHRPEAQSREKTRGAAHRRLDAGSRRGTLGAVISPI
jgi:hypothetical protein